MEALWPDSDPDAANNLNPDESEKSNLVQQFTAGSGQRAAARTLQRRARRERKGEHVPHESCRGVSGKFLGRVGEVLGKAERIGYALQARNVTSARQY